MNYKPDERAWMDYLYGEQDEAQKEKMQRYLLEHPQAQQQLQQMKEVLGILNHVEDKEVIAPPVFMDNERPMGSFWKSTAFRTVLSIAASFLLLIVAGKFLGTEVSFGKGELRISFGGAQPPAVVEQPVANSSLTTDQVQQMINSSLAQNNDRTEARLAESQQKLNEVIRQNLASNSRQINQLVGEAALASQEQVRAFVAGLQTENLQLLKDYMQLSATDQKKYMENLLVDFSKYMQEQRNQDLQMLQTRFSNMEQNTNVFKQETEQILASIISNGATANRQSNY